MKHKRILPCLDIRDQRVVKGTQFTDVQDVDSPTVLAQYYNASGADELVFYDITASVEGRGLFIETLRDVLQHITIPLTVGGGIRTVADVDAVLELGAAKVSINSGAIQSPQLINDAAQRFGSSAVVLSIDVKNVDGAYRVFAKGGQHDTGIDALAWAYQAQESGAGELVVNSIDVDGVRGGFDIEMLTAFANKVTIPIVASGGAGTIAHFVELFQRVPQIDAALAASVFHFKHIAIPDLKQELHQHGIPVQL